MAIKYIDPTLPINGDGSFLTPYNVWGTAAWWVEGDTYLQKEGTTYNGTATVFNNGPYVIGTYDATTGDQITDNSRHAKIFNPTGRGLALGTLAVGGRNNITVDNLICIGEVGPTSFREGISGTNATGPDLALNIVIQRCVVDGNYGIQLRGKGIVIRDCRIGGYNDGLVLLSTGAIVENNTVAAFPTNDGTWDGITFDLYSTVGTPDTIIVRNNRVTHPGSYKQGIYLYAGPATAAATTVGTIIIEDNYVDGFNQGIYCAFSNAQIRRNIVKNAYDPGYVNGESGGDARAFTVIADNCKITNNIAIESPYARFISLTATSGTTEIINNTVINLESGVGATTGTHTVTMENNLFIRTPQTIQPDSSMRFVNKIGTVTLNANHNHYYWPNGSFQAEVSSGVNPTWAEWLSTYETTATTGEVSFESNWELKSNSSLKYAGIFSRPRRDAYGKQMNIPPSVGAVEYTRPRNSRT